MTPGKRSGRRVAESRRPRLDRTALTALVLVLVATVAVVLTRNPGPGDLAGTTAGALVDRTLLACPDTSVPKQRSRTDIGLAPVDGPAGPLGDDGSLTAAGAESSLRRGSVETVPSSPTAVLDARGERAAGLFGFRADQVGRAAAVGGCVAPRADWWFTGAGAGLDHLSELVMSNVDPGPAVVDIRVLGAEGEIETLDTRGVIVAPGETRSIPLADIAPQNDEVVVSVRASRGRVAAAVSDRFAPRPAAPAGVEWLSGPAEPRRLLRLAGLPAAASRRTLLVGNPSELEALVDLEFSGSRGSYVPTGLETISVPPGSVRAVDVSSLLTGKEATSVRVTSQVPVVATVRSVQGQDASYAATVSPLDDPAAAPVVAGSKATIQLSAGAGGATARVAGYARNGKPTGEEEVTVDPAATSTWQPGRGTAYVVVTPLTGNVYGAATYAAPTGIATTALVSLPVRLELPGVVPAPR
jgi:hypothetical protein